MLQSEPDSEAFAAAKGGRVALIHALAISLGPDIRISVDGGTTKRMICAD